MLRHWSGAKVTRIEGKGEIERGELPAHGVESAIDMDDLSGGLRKPIR